MRHIIVSMLCLFAFFVPMEYIYVVALGTDHPLKPYRVMAIVMTLSLILYLFINKRRLRLDRIDRLFFIIFGYGYLLAFFRGAFLGQGVVDYAVNDAYLFSFCILSSIVIKNLDLTSVEIKKIVFFFLIAVVFNVAWIFWEVVSGGAVFRATGFFKNPNQAALAVALGFLYLLVYLPGSFVARVLTFSGLTAFALAIVFTGSRSALLILVITTFLWYLGTSNRSFGKFLVVVGTVIFVSVSAAAIFSTFETLESMASRFDIDNDSLASGSGRTDLWLSGVKLSMDNLFIGVGASQYQSYHQQYIDRADVYKTVLENDLGLHSDYMVMFVEFGLLSFMMYFYIVWYLVRSLIASFAYTQDRKLGSFFLLAVVGVLITGIFQEQFKLMTYWLIFSLAMAFNKAAKSEVRDFMRGT